MNNVTVSLIFFMLGTIHADGMRAAMAYQTGDRRVNTFTHFERRYAPTTGNQGPNPQVLEGGFNNGDVMSYPYAPLLDGSVRHQDLAFHLKRTKDELTAFSDDVCGSYEMLAEWNRLNQPSNPHRYEDIINLVEKAENTVGQLWVNRYPTMMEMSLLAAEGTLDNITRFVQDVAETWETLRKCGAGRYIDAVEAYQYRCIDEAGQVCHLLLHPHSLPTRSTTITPSSLAAAASSNEEQFNHRCAQGVRDIQVGGHHLYRVPAPPIAHLPSVPRVLRLLNDAPPLYIARRHSDSWTEEDPLSCFTRSMRQESPRNDGDAITTLLRDIPTEEDDDDTDEEIVNILSPSSEV